MERRPNASRKSPGKAWCWIEPPSSGISPHRPRTAGSPVQPPICFTSRDRISNSPISAGLLADGNENLLKLEVSIVLVPAGDPIDPDTAILQPVVDAYLQGTTRFNDGTLKIEPGRRVSYLKFNVSGLSGTAQSATLRLQENGDAGNGTVRVFRGSHNNGTETTLSTANAPAESGR